jgi:hypothetical protein
VVTALQKYRRESTVYESNSSLYDYLFRGMMALFGDGDCHINEVEAIKVATLLRPLWIRCRRDVFCGVVRSGYRLACQ